jgi:hypothetical protein
MPKPRVPALPPSLPRSGGPLQRAIGRLVLGLWGWRIDGEIPDRSHLVAIVAPHTSNWDVVIAIAARSALGLDGRWLGKHTLFRGPAGPLFRWLGGIPVDRSAPHGVVGSVVQEFARTPALFLAIAPEGTRKQVSGWRTGFWHIARAAGVPILPIGIDWERRVIRIWPAEAAQGATPDTQIERLRTLYHGLSGRRRRGGGGQVDG